MADEVLPHFIVLAEQTAVEGIIKGYSQDELVNIIGKSYPEVPVEEIPRIIKRSLTKIRDNTLTDIDKIIPSHIELYEKLYAEFDDLYYVPGKLKALRQKEKLAGLHKESNMVEVHNTLDIEIEVEPQYDLNKLTPDEQVRLKELMERVMDK